MCYLKLIESCPAGFERVGNTLECHPCSAETYKKQIGSGKCVKCETGTTTGGDTGQKECRGIKYQYDFHCQVPLLVYWISLCFLLSKSLIVQYIIGII